MKSINNIEVIGGVIAVKEQNRITFTKEELTEKVKVPAIVEQDLKRIISDRLEQCGLYYRVFSRIKTASSMERKFARKEYGEKRKLQDLVGVRINLYFDDDVDICRDIMEHTFDVIEWSTSQRSEEEFKPAKLNGVFRLPEYLRSKISKDTWDMYIDDTFEIQIKTMFFEGWHEIEHDMRYKGEDLWKDYPGFSRLFNSILATLELCDKSMITLFQDLGHAQYKSGRWSDMVKSHFRLKMSDAALYPEVEQLLFDDMQQQVNNLAKRIYKMDKKVLVELLLKRTRKIPINVNTIIAVLNDGVFHDSRLTDIFKARDVYNDGREESVGESRHYELRPLTRHNVFQMCTRVDGSRLKTEEPVTTDLIFKKSADYIYQWIVQRYGTLFTDMPEEITSYQADVMAYHVMVHYNREAHQMEMKVRHMDLEVGGRIWYSEASLEVQEEEVILRLCNGYAEPQHEDQYNQDNAASFFSYPGYYKAVVDNVGIYNGLGGSNRRRIIREEQLPEVVDALEDVRRKFPIVVIISKETSEGMMDEEWLDQFRVSDFTRTVWRYAHVFTCYEKVGRRLLEMAEYTEEADIPQLYIFWPDGEVDSYGPEDVSNCSFGRHLEATRADSRTYDIVRGGQAFYHKIVTDLREWNVTAEM